MIKPLRTTHFFVWRMLLVFIPIAFAFGLFFRPARNTKEKSSKTFEVETSRRDSILHITIEVLNPIMAPSCVAYAQTTNQQIFLGKLNEQGIYTFTCSADVKTILLYDAIRHKEIETITPKGL
ncbi:MAG: hypothetical protein ABI663_04600 [Chryseolinea sp.]